MSYPIFSYCPTMPKTSRRRIAVRKTDRGHPAASGALPPCHKPPRPRHEVSPSAKRRLHARIAYGRWMTLATVENLQKASSLSILRPYARRSTYPVCLGLALRRRNVSISGNRYLGTTWSSRDGFFVLFSVDLVGWNDHARSICEDLAKGSMYLRHPRITTLSPPIHLSKACHNVSTSEKTRR